MTDPREGITRGLWQLSRPAGVWIGPAGAEPFNPCDPGSFTRPVTAAEWAAVAAEALAEASVAAAPPACDECAAGPCLAHIDAASMSAEYARLAREVTVTAATAARLGKRQP
jgi:hypothetical protein